MNKKKIGKYIILGTFIAITGIVGVSAANTLTSNGVLYSNAVSNVTTVEGALNELYANYNSLLAKGNASASDILVGKKALVKGKEVTGTMTDRGLAQYGSWGCGSAGCGSGNDAYYAINSLPEGYYHSDGNSWAPEARINANTLRNQLGVSASKILSGQSIAGVSGTATSDATANAGQILNGQTAYVNGSKVTGNIPSISKGISKNTYLWSDYLVGWIPSGYYPGWQNLNGTYYGEAWIKKSDVASAIGLTSDKIAKGQTILGITGTYDNRATGTRYVTQTSKWDWWGVGDYDRIEVTVSDSNLKAENIKSGVTILGTTGTYKGAYKVYSFNDVRATPVDTNQTYSRGTWKYLVNKDNSFGYFEIDLGFTPSTLVSCNVAMTGNYSSSSSSSADHDFRFSRGYASESTNAQYWFTDRIQAQGYTLNGKYNTSFIFDMSTSNNITSYTDTYTTCNISGSKLRLGIYSNSTGTGKPSYQTISDTFYLTGSITYQ